MTSPALFYIALKKPYLALCQPTAFTKQQPPFRGKLKLYRRGEAWSDGDEPKIECYGEAAQCEHTPKQSR